MKTRGPVHTGIVLGMDQVKGDVVVFEKEGSGKQDAPLIRYWKEVEATQKPITEYVTWAPLAAVQPDPEQTGQDTDGDMDWI